MQLPIPSKCHHKLRRPNWQSIAAIDLPKMEGLPISLAYLLHIPPLHGPGNPREEQNPTLDLVLVRMPKRLLVVRESHEEVLGDEVLDADELGLGLGAVVDEALPHLLVLVGAVVVGFDLAGHVMGVEVEPDRKNL